MPAPLVLIIEDTEDSRELLADLLGAQGYRTATAANGAEALTVVAATRPDLILLDLMMPVMDGWQFRDALLADPKLADLPVIVISAVVDRQRVPPRVASFLSKPIELDDLLAAVSAALPRR